MWPFTKAKRALTKPVATQRFPSAGFQATYEGLGSAILQDFLLPALRHATKYDRLTGYFTVSSLAATAEGLEEIWRKRGRIRLVLGVHDVPKDLLDATIASEAIAEAVIRELQARLVERISTLREELLRDRIAAIAWMMKEGLLTVKVAAPRSPVPGATGIFHNKRMLFSDAQGNRMSASGSPNETVPGLSSNSEELVVHMSWKPGGAEYVEKQAASFERIWANQRPELLVRELDQTFAEQLLQAIGRPPNPFTTPAAVVRTDIGAVIDVLQESLYFAPHNLGRAALFPHQERAYLDALSRWPTRVLFADEVGLGKTLEAGATLAWLLKSGAVKRVAILTPKNVMAQWQEELRHHFGLDAWIYNSGGRTFESSRGKSVTVPKGSPVYGEHAPPICIMSHQTARGHRRAPHAFTGSSSLPDLILVDEAHAARIRREIDDHLRPTLLHKLLSEIAPRVPHLLLLTATPVQLELVEYHSTLKLLGLPATWNDMASYEGSLRLLAAGTRPPGLDGGRKAAGWLDAALEGLVWKPRELTATETRALNAFRDATAGGLVRKASVIQQGWAEFFPLLVKAHPAHLLTIRNTRQVLAQYGYKFPDRRLHAPIIQVDPAVTAFYRTVERYLTEAYGKTEEAAFSGRRINLGFAKSSYHQRLASSLHAAKLSLARRKERLENILHTGEAAPPEADEEEEDENPGWDASEGTISNQRRAAINRAVTVEGSYIADLLGQLSRLDASKPEPDPKIACMIDLLRQASGEKILVFSRYTDTIDKCIEAFRRAFVEDVPGHALYTGQQSWVNGNGEEIPSSKEGVRQALDSGDVRIVFCSDAASEGLNLQSARVLVNIDVPWNPARLEQRIGRVARLGQTAPAVEIHNLWYPESVEGKMYTRLFQRQGLYDLAVGESPELFAQAIRAEIEHRLRVRDLGPEDAIQILQAQRNALQHQALQRVWPRGGHAVPDSTTWRTGIIAVLAEAVRAAPGWKISKRDDGFQVQAATGSLMDVVATPGHAASFSLRHPLMEVLRSIPGGRSPQTLGDLHVLMKANRPFTIVAKRPTGWGVVTLDNLAGFLRAVTGLSETDPFGTEACGPPAMSPTDLGTLALNVGRFVPRAESLCPITEAAAPPHPLSDSLSWSLQPLSVMEVSRSRA